MSYIGIPPFGNTVRSVTNITATAGQTTFNITGGYVIGYVDVYLNGVLLTPAWGGSANDYTASNGLTIVLNTAASAGDQFQSLSYQPISLTQDTQPTGGGSDQVIYENGKTVTTNYTITTNTNAMSTGPITINSGISVTVPTGSRWVVL